MSEIACALDCARITELNAVGNSRSIVVVLEYDGNFETFQIQQGGRQT